MCYCLAESISKSTVDTPLRVICLQYSMVASDVAHRSYPTVRLPSVGDVRRKTSVGNGGVAEICSPGT